MDHEMGAIALQLAAESQEPLHILGFGRAPTRCRLDDVVKAQIEAAMAAKGGIGVGHGPARIEQRQDVRDAAILERGQFVDAADRDIERQEGRPGFGHRDTLAAPAP
jgi:hypothetical protein